MGTFFDTASTFFGEHGKSSAEDHTEQILIEMNNCGINSDNTIPFVSAHRVG